jgi:hypothetical protein
VNDGVDRAAANQHDFRNDAIGGSASNALLSGITLRVRFGINRTTIIVGVFQL